MNKPLRFGSAVSAVALATMIAGCAAPGQKTSFGGKTGDDVGLATRALMALNSNNVGEAIDLAERAVAKTPDDAGFRAVLGNAYFKAGRFASAETAFKDSLTIYSNQPQVILKLALVETALGKKDQAVAFLEAGQSVLDASNYGLALALAGRPDKAIDVLEGAARKPGADATVRQNLALAHALAGDWTEARTIASQDVPASQLDERIHQWMQLASPRKASDQVAALVGVTPAASDQGEPVRLALRSTDTLLAAAAPVQAPASAASSSNAAVPPVATAAADPVPAPEPKVVDAVASAAPAPAPVPAIADAPAHEAPVAAPPIAEASVPTPVEMVKAAAHQLSSAAASELKAVVASVTPKKAPAARPLRLRAVAARHPIGPGSSVVQLGAYKSPQYVNAAWATLTHRYPALRAYLPLRAKFVSPKGTFWRLSIQGFTSEREAIARCQLLKSRGGNCFVRGFAGDAPVEIASL